MSYKICVVGTGYVGLVSGATLAATGNYVTCVDIDEHKVKLLNQGIPTIYEPGLEPILKQNIEEERLYFTTNLEEAVLSSLVIFLCLPTPPNEDGSADLQHILKVVREIGDIFKRHNIVEQRIIVNKSTVPVGTADLVKSILDETFPENNIAVASNPEFLREGFAVEDSLKPERIVIGTRSKFAEEILRDLYEPFVRSGNPIYVFDERTSELVKYSANAFLATKISFMNELSALCEVVGADIEKVRIGIGSDSRIGRRFLFAGIGFGGSCFPKDIRALLKLSEEYGVQLNIVKSTYEANLRQIKRFIDKILNRFENNLHNKKFALWGLSFKPNTDDIREAPAFKIIDSLLEKSAEICAYDPAAMENAKKHYGTKICFEKNMYDCLQNADALIIATEWNQFRNPDFSTIKNKLKNPIIFDGRNLYTFEEMDKFGFEYYCVGRQKK
ncbi:MAG: UDP-glucose/GDP-mannose dehydrogenase family protein [Ignavibacteria bacterium]|nr:UDP-glucose/GDP-mannose dehydrogenase family protein [Ignavibacteria bacterium]